MNKKCYFYLGKLSEVILERTLHTSIPHKNQDRWHILTTALKPVILPFTLQYLPVTGPHSNPVIIDSNRHLSIATYFIDRSQRFVSVESRVSIIVAPVATVT
jgi:hypothetical protein